MPNQIHREARHLRDLLLAEARSRGVHVEQTTLRMDLDLPVLQLSIQGKQLRGCRIRLPGWPDSGAPDVITVHGSGRRASRMWPRKLDGTFNVPAITDHLLALVAQELSRPKPGLDVLVRVSAAVSGLHVVHLAGVRLGECGPDLKVGTLMMRIEDDRVRRRVEAHLRGVGLTDGDMRALGDAAGLFIGRSNKIDDHDPLEPIDDRILRILKVGKRVGTRIERRYVLILDRRGNKIDLADPAGSGLTRVTAAKLRTAWMLGAPPGKPWVGTVSSSRL